MDNPNTCEMCGGDAPHRCSRYSNDTLMIDPLLHPLFRRCKSVFYCNVEHQRADWGQHKTKCADLATAKKSRKVVPREVLTTPLNAPIALPLLLSLCLPMLPHWTSHFFHFFLHHEDTSSSNKVTLALTLTITLTLTLTITLTLTGSFQPLLSSSSLKMDLNWIRISLLLYWRRYIKGKSGCMGGHRDGCNMHECHCIITYKISL